MNLLGVDYHVTISLGYGSRMYVNAKKARKEGKRTDGHVYLKTTNTFIGVNVYKLV